MTPALAAQLSKNVNQHVIVIMKSQFAAAHVGSTAAAARAAAVASAQAPVMGELRQVHATHIKPYRLVNSLAATVSAGEVSRLKANPAVAEVIPDVTIHGASRPDAARRRRGHGRGRPARAASAPTSLTPNVIPGACGPTASRSWTRRGCR